MPHVDIFTDGACLGNPGPGGWAALLRMGKNEKLISGGAADTTNNRMELEAAIQGLQALKVSCEVTLTTDSRYVMQGIEQWLPNWIRKNWRTAAGKAVKNQDLWQRLKQVSDKHQVNWQWVKGHAGHSENERVDKAARQAAEHIQET